jgi:hypothetical protein
LAKGRGGDWDAGDADESGCMNEKRGINRLILKQFEFLCGALLVHCGKKKLPLRLKGTKFSQRISEKVLTEKKIRKFEQSLISHSGLSSLDGYICSVPSYD